MQKIGECLPLSKYEFGEQRLKSVCLYNIYSQTPLLIEQTCEVQVSYLQNHAVQLFASFYRILAVNPVQLMIDCKSESNITTISGVHLLKLTEACPKASTHEFLFVRTPDLVGFHELITLPLQSQAQKWLGEMSRELDLTAVMKSMDDLGVPCLRIPL